MRAQTVGVDVKVLIEALRDPAAYPHPVERVEVMQTHASVVFLAGEFAYKVKKPVEFGFLDYSTATKRLRMCRAELELNVRLAPDVYLEVTPIVEHDGRVTVGGKGTAVEHAVKMKRLPDSARLGARLASGEVTQEQLRRLAERLATFHARPPTSDAAREHGGFSDVERNCEENFTQLRSVRGRALSERVYDRLVALTRNELRLQRQRIEQRTRSAIVRDTHGDLRLEHIYLFPDRKPPGDLSIVDCIEFNDRFRYADPIADLAFLLMDMQAHGFRDEARYLQYRYFAASGDRDGQHLLPLYIAYRATIRGKVRAMQAMDPNVPETMRAAALQRARSHLLQAVEVLSSPDDKPCLLLMCGLPGTGKSALAQELGRAAGFEVIRSDVMRKSLAGLRPLDKATNRPQAGIYASGWTERTYQACLHELERRMFDGRRVIVDATFRDEAHRKMFVGVAKTWGYRTRIVVCEAPPEVVQERLANRRNDASDADWGVYQAMTQIWEPFGPQTDPLVDHIATDAAFSVVVDRCLAALRGHDLSNGGPPWHQPPEQDGHEESRATDAGPATPTSPPSTPPTNRTPGRAL